MSKEKHDWVDAMARNAEAQRRDIDARVKALAQGNTETLQCMREMHEADRDAMDYLCNFAYCVDHTGKKHDSSDVWSKIVGMMDDECARLTGCKYTNPSKRVVTLAQQIRKERKATP